ncbi:cation:proton antiporter [Streptococcus suis]|uniref:cation:proton antiporter domain-containing protein n=1 Tax=Streptococcus suis TaxID=1307 RepID=UPI000CF36E83|nr:cation:proton antiporter [Streptococcus suis]
MLLSLALICIAADAVSWLCQKGGLPKIIGFLLVGMLLGPYVGNWIDRSLLDNSADIRKIALIIILIKAGLTIKLSDFKSIGRSAVLMSFLPACAELVGYTLLAPLFFDLSYGEAALMGSVMAAVSPAVVVPRMVDLIENKIGRQKKIPQLILAGASFDDVVVIVLFTAFLSLVQKGDYQVLSLVNIPLTILTSMLVGVLAGLAFARFLKTIRQSDSLPPIYQYLLLFSLSFLLATIEARYANRFPFSGLLAILVGTMVVNRQALPVEVAGFAGFFSRLWVIGEIFLFVLVGSIVDISYVAVAGLPALGLIALTLVIRSLVVWLSVSGNGFSKWEKLFCVIAYLPKATVQAAIGGIPLAAGLDSGQLILSVAVLGILVTAPLGAILLDRFGKELLEK